MRAGSHHDRRFVQLLLLALGESPLGKSRYWPIYAAAERHGFSIVASHSAAKPSLTARANAAARFSSRKKETGNRQFAIAPEKPKGSSKAVATRAGVLSASSARQSARRVSGASGG